MNNQLSKLEQIDELQRTIESQGKLDDDVLKKVNYKLRLEWNYTSNSMEGNSLTKAETRTVMVGNVTVNGKPIKDVLEMKGHDEVISNIMKMGKGELNIAEGRIKEIHKGIMHEEDPEKRQWIGQWKNTNNHIYNYKNERFEFVDHTEVKERMHQLMNWLSSEQEKIERKDKKSIHPAMLAIRFHLEYISIHPFYDGNGRTSRILTNLILIRYGYPPLYIKGSEKDQYYQYLADIQGYGGGPDLFFDLMLGLLIRSQTMVVDAIEGKEIEEPDDWEKKLAMLKKEAEVKEGIKVVHNESTIEEIIYKSVLPAIETLLAKLSKFDSLFAERQILFGNDGMSIQNKEDAVKLFLEAPGKFIWGASLQYEWRGYKHDSMNIFSCSLAIRWNFERYDWNTVIDSNESNIAEKRLYHQQYSNTDINKMVSTCGEIVLNKIETAINKKQVD